MHPALLFTLIFNASQRWVFFNLPVVFTQTDACSGSANKRSSDRILAYQMLYMMLPTLKQRDPLTAIRLDISWRLV